MFISTKEKSITGEARSVSGVGSARQIPAQSIESEAAFSLLKSAIFSFQVEDGFNWGSQTLIAAIIRCETSKLPKNRSDFQALIHSDYQRLYESSLRSLNWEGARYQIQYQLRTGEGHWIWVEETAERTNSDENPLKVEGVIRDITDEKSRFERSDWLARHDEMTGLMNQKAFLEHGKTLCGLSRRVKAQGAVFRLRLNNLDDVRTTYGFETANRLCRGVADRLRQIIAPPDCLAKGEDGDFLLAVLGIAGPDSDPGILAKRLQIALSDSPYKSPSGPLRADVSIGYTSLPQSGGDFETLIRKTDRALEARSSGAVSEYSVSMGLAEKQNHNQNITKEDILSALDEKRVSLAYQPIVKALSGELHHYECLLRLREESGELVSAGRFIMAAEKLGLVHHLDRRALELAAAQLSKSPHLRVALNVSADTIQNAEAAKAYLEVLKSLNEKTRRMTIEMTETAALDAPELATHFSAEVRALGCEFSIDDFGSGHTTFRNLMAIEAESIKLDGSLIRGISASSQKQIFVRMMVDLADTFAVKIVAEMVEDRADATALKHLGVDYLQGYLYGVPSASPSYRNFAS
jgi:diguanylate cyclase (GGDEF)-like protein